MTVNEAMAIMEDTKPDYCADSLYEGLLILKKYSPERIHFQFEHDQCWVGAIGFDEYVEVMSEDDIRRMAVLGWFHDEESWSQFS